MIQNVNQVLDRGERLDVLVDRTEDLRDQVRTSSSNTRSNTRVHFLALDRYVQRDFGSQPRV
jgi:hypothetical protein